jgi:vitamin B12 transporter
MTQGLSRIEILRGPQGLLYGADAGGVISIRSEQPTTGFTGALRTEYGAEGFNQYGLNIAGGNEQISGALSASDLATDGINARTDDTVDADLDGYENQTIHSTVTAQVNDSIALTASFHDIEGNNEYDGCYDTDTFALINNCQDNYAQRAWRVAASWKTTHSNHELAYGESQTDRQFLSAEIESYRTAGDNKTVSFLGSWQASNEQRLTYGVDISTQSLDDGSQKSRDNTGIYTEWLQQLGNTTLTAGVRYDDNEDFGDNTAWRVSAVHPIALATGDLTLRAAAGTGFRAPSLYEIAYNSGPFAYAPALATDLAQETTGGWEIAARFEQANHSSEIIYFDQWIDDEIYFDLAGYSGYLQRAGKARATGIELVSEVALSARFKLIANGAWTETETQSGAQRPYRPTWLLRVGLQWQNEQARVALTSRSAADTVDINNTPADDYSVVDLSATYQLGAHVLLNTRFENLFDSDYQQVPGYNNQGRAWYAGVQYAF